MTAEVAIGGHSPPTRSLTRETLYRIAAGVTLIVTLSTGVTYYVLYRAIEQRALARLTDYSVQRARYHESHFALLKGLHTAVREDFIQRYTAPPARDVEVRFRELMSRYPDGAIRNSETFSDVERYASGWIHRRVQPDREFKRRWLLYFDLAEKYKTTFTSQFANIYFLHPTEPANMGYDDPERSGHVRWVYQTPGDYALDAREYFNLADAMHNPRRETVWGGTYFEPSYAKILVPALTPVYVGGHHVANIGTDDILDELEASIVQSDIPGASHTVFRRDGRLIIDSAYKDRIVGSFDGFNIRDAGDLRLETLLTLATGHSALPLSGVVPVLDQYYAISSLPSPGWYFASTLPGSLVRSDAFRGAQWVLWTGLGSLAVMLISLAAILKRQIGQPLNQLLAGIRGVAGGSTPAIVVPSAADELQQLALAFNDMVRTISERDAALHAEKERFRALIEQGADIISVVDPDGVVKYVSPSIERVLGWQAEQFLGQHITAIVHPADAESVRATFRSSLTEPGRPVSTGEYRRRHADGRWRWFQAIGTNQVDNPAVRGVVVNARDITETKQAKDELQRQRDALYQREKLAAMGSLLAGVAHELNNPLSIVVGRAIMLEEDAGDDNTRAAAEKIRLAAERCSRIVKTFLAMARQRTPERGLVRIDQLIDGSLDILGYSLRSSGIEVAIGAAEQLPEILADGNQLHQVLVNLLVNAQQALAEYPEPRRIVITSGCDPVSKRVWMEVADNGPGIPADLRTRIFEPYFTTKPNGVGTGVGLAVSQGIIEAHYGTLSVSCPPAGGSIFRIELPRGDTNLAPPEEDRDDDGDGARSTSQRILIVDDEVEVGAMLAEILRAVVPSVEAVGSGRDALKRIAADPAYDLLLTDLRMPEMDGPALYRAVRERWPELARRVVFVTGDTLSPDARKLLEEFGRPAIEKPFLPADIRRRVAEWLSQRP